MSKPKLEDKRGAYQNGLIDAVRGNTSADALLELAGRHDLRAAYTKGMSTGFQLVCDKIPGLLVEERMG